MKKEYLEAGKIVTTHGIRGEVKIMPYTDTPELLCEFDRLFIGKDKAELYIERARVAKNMVIAKIEGVDTVEAAEKYRNKVLFMHRDDLELDEDTYFIQDLIDMEVKDADSGFVYGKITDVLQNGANDVYVIKGDREYLVPAIPDVVIS
ncbi:MAG: 16S rRNA processing protein RimM, partial [Ruminococcus sp.]|nr:16S rRNA processing protein RimM [Ruminococcus sp.]